MSARRRSRRSCERVLQTTPAMPRPELRHWPAVAPVTCGSATISRTGIPDDLVQQALDGLEPEADRARSVVSRRGTGRTARYLHGKGFSEDVIAGAVAGRSAEELG